MGWEPHRPDDLGNTPNPVSAKIALLRSRQSDEQEVGDMESQRSRAGQFRGMFACVVVLSAAVAMLGVPAGASAASPVLEFVAPGHSLSEVSVTTESGLVTAELAGSKLVLECAESHGQGEITGPRSVLVKYQFTKCEAHEPNKSHHPCQSVGAEKEEITTAPIEADLVWIDQAKHEVGMLLNPNGSPTQPYISFECSGEKAKGFGPFLSPGSPINQDVQEFTMTLKRAGSTQTVTKYEGEKGETLEAVPTGEKEESGQRVDTSVEMTVAVHTSVPVEVRAITAAEVEAKQREEEATAKKHQEEAAKKKQEEEAAATAAAKKKQEEEAAKKLQESKNTNPPHKSKLPTRSQRLAKALKQCKKDKSKKARALCVAKAEKKYGTRTKKKQHSK
jgi:hypothetical protein